MFWNMLQIKNMVKENWNTTLADKGDNDPFVQGVENLQQEVIDDWTFLAFKLKM